MPTLVYTVYFSVAQTYSSYMDDAIMPVYSQFSPHVVGRVIRIEPTSYLTEPAIRFELTGLPVGKLTLVYLVISQRGAPAQDPTRARP